MHFRSLFSLLQEWFTSDEVGNGVLLLLLDFDASELTLGCMHMCSLDPRTALGDYLGIIQQ